MESRMNKTVVRKVKVKDQGNDFEFWQTKSFEERLSVLEELRRDYYGVKHGIEPRLQRVYRGAKRKRR
jgi:hypothetical protein